MSIRFRQLDPKARGRMLLANISLTIGLVLWLFVHPASQVERNWFHGISGFLLGVSITINLLNLRSSSRCSDARAGKL
ncbi:MAG: hypothetical protein ABR905_13540 [Terracidiphilus sp.]|jgi:hypothetical protein